MKKREKGIKTPFRVLIYGKQGDGKTSVTRFAPGPVALLTLDNTDKVLDNVDKDGIVERFYIEDYSKILSEINEFIEYVANSEFKTVVFDNLSALEKVWFVNAADEGKNNGINTIQHYGKYSNQLIKMLSYIDSRLKDKNVIYTAWQRNGEIWLESGQKITPFQPDLRDSVNNYFMGTVHAVTHIKYDQEKKERYWTLTNSTNEYAKNQIDGRKRADFDKLFDWEA